MARINAEDAQQEAVRLAASLMAAAARTAPKARGVDSVATLILDGEDLETLAAAGVVDFVTVGPGKALRGHLRRTLGSRARVLGTESPDDFSRTVEALR